MKISTYTSKKDSKKYVCIYDDEGNFTFDNAIVNCLCDAYGASVGKRVNAVKSDILNGVDIEIKFMERKNRNDNA